MSQSLLDRVKAKRQSFAAKSNQLRPMTLQSAKNLVRILPNWAGTPDGDFFHDFANHYIKDAKGNMLAVYICTEGTFGRACDVCSELATILAETTDDAAIDLLKEARAGNRILVNAIIPTGSHPNAKTDPVLLSLPPTVFDMMLAAAEEAMESDSVNIFDLAAGHDFAVTKSGSGRDTKYGVTLSLKARKIDANVLEKAIDLDKYVEQEFEQGKLKALAQLRAVAIRSGVSLAALPGPSGTIEGFSRPGGGNSAALSAARPLDTDDVIEVDVTTVRAAKPSPKVESIPEASSESEIDEIEALLAELGQ